MDFGILDGFTYNGALTLKRIIENFWEKKGLFPAVRVERQYFGHEQERWVYVVRSDLVIPAKGKPYVRRTASEPVSLPIL